MVVFADPKKDYDFVCLYDAMCAFDNSPASCKALSAACAKVNMDYDKMRTDLLAFDCHGDTAKYIEKVDRKFRILAVYLKIQLED